MVYLRFFFFSLTAGLTLTTSAQQRDALPPGTEAQYDFYGIRPATINCVIEAAQRQRVPANVLLAIASVEGGKNGQIVENTNGTFDLGHLQINSIHFAPSGRFGKLPITKEDVTWRGCYNAELAAWILRQHLEEPDTGKDFWTRAANYHSRTPEHNARYRQKLIPLSRQWGDWLQKRYTRQGVSVTHE
ncbi:MAG: transglycosylase SLT domain-containing protein [Azoarcus sp.]|jgi:hypothetical protein|nr:transglycosylase SLT domain-containing protein [Azoarcus sp.]